LVGFVYGGLPVGVGEINEGGVDATLNIPYRNCCWVYFDDCFIGQFNRPPDMKFVIRKSPSCSFDSSDAYRDVAVYDYNAAHALWYIWVNMIELPNTWLDDTTFLAVAGTLFDEKLGISILFDRQQSAMAYIESILSHVNIIMPYNVDATFHLKAIRDDY